MQLLRMAAFSGEYKWNLPTLFRSNRVKIVNKGGAGPGYLDASAGEPEL